MMTRRLVPSLLLVLAFLAAAACSGRSEEGLSVSFDVETLPPPPPEPEPEVQLPPPPPPPPPAPDPETLRRQRLQQANDRMRPIYFQGDSWKITPEGSAALQADASALVSMGTFRATVEGHTDARGTQEYRQWLGLWRAKVVKDQLRDLGVDPSRLTLVSRADSQLISNAESEEERAPNRRVEIVIQSLD